MSANPMQVKGADNLARTCHLASRELEDFSQEGGQAAAQLLASARGKTPRRTGRLAGSLTSRTTATEVQVGSGLVYAGRTHYGWAAVGQRAQPFLTDALAEQEKAITDNYFGQVVKALQKVRGA